MTIAPEIAFISKQVGLSLASVHACVTLLNGGATVPFIARYRKEATGGVDESQLRAIEQQYQEQTALTARKATILHTLTELGIDNKALLQAIADATDRTVLEELYLPHRPKRQTRAQKARDRGLLPLAERIRSQALHGDPQREAQAFVDADRQVPDRASALAGAQDIVAEMFSEDATIRADLRLATWRHGRITARRKKGDLPAEAETFRDYFNFEEPVARIPSHRYLALCRGETQGVLTIDMEGQTEDWQAELLRRLGHVARSPWASFLQAAVSDGWQRLLWPAITSAVRSHLKEQADAEAIAVFASNVKDLLLAPPWGPKSVLAVDPGLRTGCKIAAVDDTGQHLAHDVLYLVQGDTQQALAKKAFLAMVSRFRPSAVAVGNGTGGREAEAFLRQALREAGLAQVPVVAVSEAGASVYSASELARSQHPDLDVTVRGALSIGRRLQDPLAELVQIEPKSIGVGQYQHDVDQGLLSRKLAEVVESCVNQVGVHVNTASQSLLTHVAGIGPSLARQIALHRQQHGPFQTRRDLLKVKGLGPKAFEQAAGFLRIQKGEEPLDASAVHPERYPLVRQMAKDLGIPLGQLLGNTGAIARIDAKRYQSAEVGAPTLADVLAELERPGRDPRPSLEPVAFRADVQTMADLKPGMRLPGVVTNVAAFGAFIDIGVHQDGLVHVSELADRFVRDPREIVHAGQGVQATVLSVDAPRKRIALSLKTQPQLPSKTSN